MRKIVLFVVLLAGLMSAHGQATDWQQVKKLIDDGSYRTAYSKAEAVYHSHRASARSRLTAAFYMAQAGAAFEEDAADSARARYRALLPQLEGVDLAVCHAFLGDYAAAMSDTALLQHTPTIAVEEFCRSGKTKNMTPTVFDMLALMQQDRGELSAQQMVALQKRVCALHAHDADADLRIWHDLRLLQLMDNVPNHPVRLSAYQQYINKYRHSGSPMLTRLYHAAAQYCHLHNNWLQAKLYCDTAVSLDAKSQGGVDCANLRAEITSPWFYFMSEGRRVSPDVPSVLQVAYRNVDHLWVRVIPYKGDLYREESRKRMLKAQPVVEWDVALPSNSEYRQERAYITVPALPSGEYVMLVSTTANPDKDGFVAYELSCTDMVLVGLRDGQYLLLDSRTGSPIVGQEVKLVDRSRKDLLIATTHTGAEGRFGFGKRENRWGEYVVIDRGGYVLRSRYGRELQADVDTNLRCELRVDRPIYRPTDTLHVAVLAYHSNGLDASAAEDQWLYLQLNDPNANKVWEDSVMTDAFGVGATTAPLPPDGMPGNYRLQVKQAGRVVSYEWLRVEPYRQPRFMVSLAPEQGVVLAFDRPMRMLGMATTYSGVAVGGAKVHYTVLREQSEYYGRLWLPQSHDIVGEGEVEVEADGTFGIEFIPQVDSSVRLAPEVSFRYTVRVDVTDLNGETHEAMASVRVGFCNAFVGIEPEWGAISQLDSLQLYLTDLNGNPLQGELQVRVVRLQRPEQVRLAFSAMKSSGQVHHTLGREEWRKTFPLYAYDSTDLDPRVWPEAQVVLETTCQTLGGKATMPLPKIQAGVYKVLVETKDAKPAEYIYTLTPLDCGHVQSADLLWVDLENTTAEVGQRLRLRFGSAVEGTQIYYRLCVGGEERCLRRVECNTDAIHTEYIGIDTSMLGSFTVQLFTVREGVVAHWEQWVHVPFSHKRLDVQIATFRDHLQPGQTEEWTIRVATEGGARRSFTPSAVILSMYDDALNTYGNKTEWSFYPWRIYIKSLLDISQFDEYGSVNHMRPRPHVGYKGNYPTVWQLREGIPYYITTRMYKSQRNAALASSTALLEVEEVSDESEEYFADIVIAEDAAFGMSALALEDDEEDAGEAGSGQVTDTPVVRENLSPLAFFAADIRTDSTGTATYRFTLPDLLTRWNVVGMAVDKEMRVGTLNRTLVANKPLMVQPNMPRFLRQGDSLTLLSKVVFAEMPVSKSAEVTLLIADAATADTLCYQSQVVAADQPVVQVRFDVEVPSTVHALAYCVTALAEGMSDGERGQIPVVSNRQTVSVSKAVYINGVGEKEVQFPLAAYNSPTAEPQLLMAEVVSNPVWLALRCMPYMQTHENPSSLYLANQLHVNTLGTSVLKQVKGLGVLDTVYSPLRQHEDVRQTALEHTPWVHAAQAEEEQMLALNRYFDSTALANESDRAAHKLQQMQNADGGWPWMPEGESSLWVTQQVLQQLSGVPNLISTEKALAFVDREQQHYYEKYVKPHAKKYRWQPTDVDYLYMRSQYGKAKTEAYRFYYANALKNYSRYEHLYTQAQLALVFHRGGNHKQALDLLRRVKEKAVSSDEMGMYWRDNRSGWFWYQRPIETQALLVRAFAEIDPTDTLSIGQMQQWLLRQKQTTHWGNERATAEAIGALMVGTSGDIDTGQTAGLVVYGDSALYVSCGQPSTEEKPEGYASHSWTGEALHSLMQRQSTQITIAKRTPGTSWGSVVYQYTDDLDRIPTSDMGIRIGRSYSKVGSGKGDADSTWHVGDRVKVRIEIFADRAMDYLELVDSRPACIEPLSTQAGWRWTDGLHYYTTVNNTDTRLYIEHLERGHYVAEYEAYITMPGHFLSGLATMQCMYAPEFRANTGAVLLEVGSEK